LKISISSDIIQNLVIKNLLMMNILPSGWQIKVLGEVATLQRGFDLPVGKRVSGEFPIFAANGMIGTHNLPKVKAPGVVTGRSGTLGKVYYVEHDYWPLNTALWVKDFHGNDPKWVARLLGWMKLESYTRGTGVPTLNRNLVHVIPVMVPPIEEQRRIAAILDQADAVRRKRQEAIRLTEELLRATFLDMFGDPVTNPKGWDVKNFGSLIMSKNSSRIPLKQSDRAKRQGIYPYYGASGVIDTIDDYLFDGEYLLIGEDGANLLSRSTPIAFRATGKFWVNNHAHIVADNGLADLRFLEQFFSLISLELWITGSAQPKLNWSNLAKIPVPTPPIQLQQKFKVFHQRVSEMSYRLHEFSHKQENLFNSLLQRAFRGEL